MTVSFVISITVFIRNEIKTVSKKCSKIHFIAELIDLERIYGRDNIISINVVEDDEKGRTPVS